MELTSGQRITIRGGHLKYRNFRGLSNDYNKEGDRNTRIVIDEKLAQDLIAAGVDGVKINPPREEGDAPECLLRLLVRYYYEEDGTPSSSNPNVWLVTKNGRKRLLEKQVGNVDTADIDHVDAVFRIASWKYGQKRGLHCKLVSLFCTLIEDPLEEEYKDVPEINSSDAGERYEEDVPPFEEED